MCYGIEELGVGDVDGNDVWDVEFEEVEVVEDVVDVGVFDEDEDEEGNCEEVEDGGDDGGVLMGWRSGFGGYDCWGWGLELCWCGCV